MPLQNQILGHREGSHRAHPVSIGGHITDSHGSHSSRIRPAEFSIADDDSATLGGTQSGDHLHQFSLTVAPHSPYPQNLTCSGFHGDALQAQPAFIIAS